MMDFDEDYGKIQFLFCLLHTLLFIEFGCMRAIVTVITVDLRNQGKFCDV